jgi:Protein of unknown function (DUF2924)
MASVDSRAIRARSIAFGRSTSRTCGANGGGSTTVNRRGSVATCLFLPSVTNVTKRMAGLGKSTRRKLQTMAKALRITGRVGPTPSLSLKPGRTYTVTVTEDGFEYAGANYPSLTKVAKKITGAHWSGPRFFGLLAAGAEPPSNGGRDG